MIPDWLSAVVLVALIIASNIIGYYQGKAAGVAEGFKLANESNEVIERWALGRARITAILKRYPAQWYELPPFLRRDALAQQWRRRR